MVDPSIEKHFEISGFVYTNNNPIKYIDPDGNDWFYHSRDGKSKPEWLWHDGKEYNTGVKNNKGEEVVLQGREAVVVFNGNMDEKLGKGDNFFGEGAKLADVTVYGPGGKDDIQRYKGYTMSSDPTKFGVVAEGDYIVNRIENGEKLGPYNSEWTLNNRGNVSALGNYNPAHPERTIWANKSLGYKGGFDCDQSNSFYALSSFLDGVFVHRPNYDGFSGTFFKNGKLHGVSEGCLLIDPTKWEIFNNKLKTINNFLLQINRK